MLLRSPRAWLSTVLVFLSACAAEAPAPIGAVAAAAPATSPMGALERPTTPAALAEIAAVEPF